MDVNTLMGIAIIILIIFTGIYFWVSYKEYIDKMYTLGLYLILIVITQFIVNYFAIESHCDSKNASGMLTYLMTLTPWIFIFGVLVGVIYMFDSWKEPFANTFGIIITDYVFINKPEIEEKRIKSLVSECIWYIITGILTIVMTFSSIGNISCNIPLPEMIKRDNQYKIEQEERMKANKKIDSKIYSVKN